MKVEQCEELKELALHLFKTGEYKAEDAYDKALSFLSVNKDSLGRDILEKVVKYNSGVIGGKLCWTLLFEGTTHNLTIVGVSDDDLLYQNRAIRKYVEDKVVGSYNTNKTIVNAKIELDKSISVLSDNIYHIAGI